MDDDSLRLPPLEEVEFEIGEFARELSKKETSKIQEADFLERVEHLRDELKSLMGNFEIIDKKKAEEEASRQLLQSYQQRIKQYEQLLKEAAEHHRKKDDVLKKQQQMLGVKGSQILNQIKAELKTKGNISKEDYETLAAKHKLANEQIVKLAVRNEYLEKKMAQLKQNTMTIQKQFNIIQDIYMHKLRKVQVGEAKKLKTLLDKAAEREIIIRSQMQKMQSANKKLLDEIAMMRAREKEFVSQLQIRLNTFFQPTAVPSNSIMDKIREAKSRGDSEEKIISMLKQSYPKEIILKALQTVK